MKEKYIHRFYAGAIGDMKNLERHFSEMAEKGYMIDKIGVFSHRYRVCQPCKKKFFVDFLPQITPFDYPENEDAQNYRSICENSGWTFIASNKQFHVFCTESDSALPIPIHTDNKIQAQIYMKASMRYELPWVILAFCMLFISSPLNNGAEILLRNLLIFSSIGMIAFYPGFIWLSAFIIQWNIRTFNAAKNDLPMPKVNFRLAKIRNNLLTFGILMSLSCTIIGFCSELFNGLPIEFFLLMFAPFLGVFVGFWVRKQIDTKRRTRAGNIGLFIVSIVVLEIVIFTGMTFAIKNLLSSSNTNDSATLDNRPALTLKDIGITNEPTYANTTINGSLLVPVNYEHYESSKGAVNTHVYRSVNKIFTNWLYESFSKEFYKSFSYRLSDFDELEESIVILSSEEAAFWGAEKGLSFNSANNDSGIELLLLNDKMILRISASGEKLELNTICQAIQNLWDK